MSKRKGLSADEKKTRLLEFFHEKKDVFTLKDLEKMAPKAKGIVSQSVKEVLMTLVSEDLVETDKIGSSTYFWSFPSKTINTKIQKMEEMKKNISEMKLKSKQLDSELKKYEIDEKESQIRTEAFDKLHSLEKRRNQLKAKLDLLKDCDPELLQQMKKDCNLSKEAINRWTDNVFLVKSWCKQKFSLEDSQINKQFAIPEDFDYPE